MWLELGAAAYLLGQYIYHRITEKDPPDPSERLEAPKVTEGQTVPIFFGRVRIRRPLIAWYGGARASLSGTSPTGRAYEINMLLVVGYPFYDGTTHLRNIWWGEYAMETTFDVPPNIGGTGYVFESQPLTEDDPEFTSVTVEFGDGVSTQDLGVAPAQTRTIMVVNGVVDGTIPGFRGVATVFTEIHKFTSTLPDVDIELSTYPQASFQPVAGGDKVGDDANPVDVIAASLCDQNGKNSQSPLDVLDQVSFARAAATLLAEGHGISISWEDRRDTREMINDVLKQIDAALWQEQSTGRWHIKLIRADYSPADVRQLNPSNCRIENFAAGGYVDTPNAVRIVYPNRLDGYRDNAATAQNLANAVGQNGERIEVEKRFPGVTTKELAEAIAARELAWVSKPAVKCTAIASRAFINARPGDVLRLLYPQLNLSNRIMRVAAVAFGASSDNSVRLELIEDAFYVHRGRVHPGGSVTPFPTPPILEMDPE